MRVLTWNVYFGGHMFEARLEALFRELERRAPDVIALQEVTPALLEALVEEPWTRAYDLSDRSGASLGAYGVLVLARRPLENPRWLDLPTRMGRRLLATQVGGLTVATVHLESYREDTPYRLAQLERIFDFLRGDRDVLLAGDMNFRPDDEAETNSIPGDYVDVWPALRPGEPGFTVDTDINAMRYQLKREPSHKRIDRVFLRAPSWHATSIELVGTTPIDPDGTFVSDHFGLEVTLEPAP